MIIVKGGKELRTGYTTGSCAAAAATAAIEMLLTTSPVSQAVITLPNGDTATFDIVDATITDGYTSCAVIKDAGDDPDATNGMLICALCSLAPKGIAICGGVGIGVVTEAGLPIAKGQAAINPVPLAMIEAGVAAVCNKYSYSGGAIVEISAPKGEEVAKRTFNPQIGIIGGISILGTTGIVEPMSEKAIVDTIKLLMDKRRAESDTLIMTLGNYGMAYCASIGLEFTSLTTKPVKCSNFIGESLDYAVYKGFKKLILVGHAGKLIKLAAGIMNTHSAMADGRMEILCTHAALVGASQKQVCELFSCVTTSAAIEKLDLWGITDLVFASIMDRIAFHVNKRLKGLLDGEIIMFEGERTLARVQV